MDQRRPGPRWMVAGSNQKMQLTFRSVGGHSPLRHSHTTRNHPEAITHVLGTWMDGGSGMYVDVVIVWGLWVPPYRSICLTA